MALLLWAWRYALVLLHGLPEGRRVETMRRDVATRGAYVLQLMLDKLDVCFAHAVDAFFVLDFNVDWAAWKTAIVRAVWHACAGAMCVCADLCK